MASLRLVRGIGEGAHGLADHVDLPVGRLAAGDGRIERPGADPGNVGAGFVVGGVLHGDAACVHEAAHEALGHVVGGVVIGAGEVLLADVVEGIVDAGAHLVVGHGEGELGVHDGKLGHHLGAKDVADLEALLVVGDDGAGVHLRAGAAHGEDVAHGDDPAVGTLHLEVELLPRVAVVPGAHRDALRVVDDRAAAHREDEVHVVLARNPAAFVELLDGGVAHDARILKHVLPRGGENGDDLVIEAGSFDGPAAVGEHDVGAKAFELLPELVEGIWPKVDADRVVVGKVAEHGAPLAVGFPGMDFLLGCCCTI